jgi:hypothetical protein
LQTDDETAITEISFLPDGRVCVFGMSREVLQLLGELALGDPALSRRYEQLRCEESAMRPPPRDDATRCGMNVDGGKSS